MEPNVREMILGQMAKAEEKLNAARSLLKGGFCIVARAKKNQDNKTGTGANLGLRKSSGRRRMM